jgi:hypothetical protein
LRIEQRDLAVSSGVPLATIRRLEKPGGITRVNAGRISQVALALERAGAEFIEDGVRRRRVDRADRKAMVEDLIAIARDSAANLTGKPAWTEDDLYDEAGLPA